MRLAQERAEIPAVGEPTSAGISAVWDVVCGGAEVAAALIVAGDDRWREIQRQVVWPYYLRALELEDQFFNRQAQRRAMGVS